MKKNVLCVIFAIILCSSCQSSSLEKKYTVPGSVPDTSAKQPDIPETDNFTDYNDLITKTDDIHYIAENFFSSNIYGSGSISDIAGTVGIFGHSRHGRHKVFKGDRKRQKNRIVFQRAYGRLYSL